MFFICAAIVLFASPFFVAHAAGGASLYIQPSGGTFTVGSTFTVSIYVNTGGQYINAVDANLIFPPDKLQVVSPDSGKSFIQEWVGQPSYSNSDGTLSFQGAVPTPGINTDAGLLSTVTFRVMQPGTAALQFGNSKVLLNDGYGTNALTQTTNGVYTLQLPPPAGPIVTSPTNPDQTKWYNNGAAILQWQVAPDVQGISYTLDDNPMGVPEPISEGLRTSVVYSDLADGIHYFHIRAFSNGQWGGVTDYAILTDIAPPASFGIGVTPGVQTPDQHPVFTFETTDAASGIDYYELEIVPLAPSLTEAGNNNQQFFIEADSPYTQSLDYGDYDVYVRAYDNAGNYTQEVQRVSITKSIFGIVENQGLRFGSFIVSWPYVDGIALVILLLLLYLFIRAFKRHKELEEILQSGAENHPDIAAKLAKLHNKQKEYNEHVHAAAFVIALALSAASLLGIRASHAYAATSTPAVAPSSTASSSLALDPPLINVAPSSISNNQILYLGGWANIPGAQVVLHIEETETGQTFDVTAPTGNDGNWFYSFPQFLDSGHYVAWAELEFDNETSAPSARVDIAVEPTALAIGSARFDYEEIYLILFILFFAAALILAASLVRFKGKIKLKRAKLEEALRDADESLKRGFAVLRRDIELELETLRKVKMSSELSEEEKDRETKLTRDLDEVNDYVGKEIWRAEEEEKGI
jgi:hypothetical protein